MRQRRKWEYILLRRENGIRNPCDLLSFNRPNVRHVRADHTSRAQRRRSDHAAAGRAALDRASVGTRSKRPIKSGVVYPYPYQKRPKTCKSRLSAACKVCNIEPCFGVAVTKARTVACPVFPPSLRERTYPRGGSAPPDWPAHLVRPRRPRRQRAQNRAAPLSRNVSRERRARV